MKEISALRWLDQVIDICLMGFAAFSMFSISLTQISAGVGAIAWLIRVHITCSWKKLTFPLGQVFLIFIAACVIGVLTSLDPSTSVVMLKKILLGVIFFWVVNAIRDREQRELLLKILLISAVLASLNGILQAVFTGISKSNRVEGTMSIYMTFAGVLMLVSIMALSRLIFYRKFEALVALAVSLFVICLLLTLTRQAWLGLIAGAGFLIFKRNKNWLLVIPVFFLLVILFSSGAVKDRLWSMVNFKDRTFLIRLDLWKGGWEIFKDHPITGCGFKCVDRVYSHYPEHARVLQRYKGMHNNIVQIAVDTGLIGLIAWLSIWIKYFFVLHRRSKSLKNLEEDRWIQFGSIGITIGFFSGGLFEVNFYDSEVVMLLYFLMAMPLYKPLRNSFR
tara:strand:- start:716 stop:1888 length:1173 start_codon:yes stop_codon:yes gene_type:complete